MNSIIFENDSTILIQNYDGCNLNCQVCAYHSQPVKGVRMTDEVFALVRHRLIEFDKCAKKYRVVFGYCAEPTLDISLAKRIKDLRFCLNNASIGIHTNGVLLKNNLHLLKNTDQLMLSILGSSEGEHSFEKITGLSFDRHIDLIKNISQRFEGNITIIVSLRTLENKTELEKMLYGLKDTGVEILLNQLEIQSSGVRTIIPFNTDVLADLQKNGVNGLKVHTSSATMYREDNLCDMLVKEMPVYTDGSYGICCIKGFGENAENSGVENKGIMEWLQGDAKNICRNFMIKNQRKPLLSCSDCILIETFGARIYRTTAAY